MAYSKVGMYTAEEFDQAFGTFKNSRKPFIFTYFKKADSKTHDSLQKFKEKLSSLGHFYSNYNSFNDLWTQFNKELDRLETAGFKINDHGTSKYHERRNIKMGEKGVYIEKGDKININMR